jgi:hypothetical protein
LLSGLSGQLKVLTVGCPEHPAAAFQVGPVHHAVDCDRARGIVLRRGTSTEEQKESG